MNAVIFDTETNGMIKNWGLPLNSSTLDNFPRITQLAWQKVSLETGQVLNEFQSIIKPDGWTIPTVEELQEVIRQKRLRGWKAKDSDAFFFVDNNMSTERCETEGRPLTEVLPLIISDLQDSEIVVAHNMNFDIKVFGAECIRYNANVGKKLVKVCTMESTTELCRLPPFRSGKHKYPKLVELYKILFKEDMKGNHDAFADVIGCRECFLELIRLNHINL